MADKTQDLQQASGLPLPPFSSKDLSTLTQMQRGQNDFNGINAHRDDESWQLVAPHHHLTTTLSKHKPSHIPTLLFATRTYRCCSSGMTTVVTAATAVNDVGGIAVGSGM